MPEEAKIEPRVGGEGILINGGNVVKSCCFSEAQPWSIHSRTCMVPLTGFDAVSLFPVFSPFDAGVENERRETKEITPQPLHEPDESLLPIHFSFIPSLLIPSCTK